MAERKALVVNSVFYSLGEIIPRVFSFLLLPVLTRYLSTYEYGVNSYVTAIMTFMFVISSLSLNTYVLRNYYLEENELRRKELIGGVFAFICIFNVFLLILQTVFFPFALKQFDVDIPFYPFFFLAIFNNFFDAMSIVPLVLFRVKGNAKGFFYLSISRIIFQYIFIYILVVYMEMGLVGTFYARLFVNIPFAVIYIILIARNGKIHFDKKLIRTALLFSLPLLPGSLSYLIITLSDRVIMEKYVSLNSIGIYSVAFTLSIALNVVIQALYKTLEPVLFKEHRSENFEALNDKLYRYFISLVFAGGFFIAIFSKEVFAIAASKDFQEGYKLVPAMIVSVIIAGITLYLTTLLIAKGKQKIVSVGVMISAVFSIVFNFIIIPPYGTWGAVASAVVASLIAYIIGHAYVYIRTRLIWQQALLLIVVFAAPYIVDISTEKTGFFMAVVIKSVVFILFIVLVALVLGFNIRQESVLLLESVRKSKRMKFLKK
jgi:O-antigen/teichoic acid export membrane protein